MLCYVMLFYVTSYNSTEVNKKVDIKRVGIVIRMTLVLFLVLITRLGRVNAWVEVKVSETVAVG